MATYTSSQSGNFSAAATWGGSGPPGDGDDFNVASGHTVTIDSGISQPTNGYHDSYIYGVLKNDTSANTELRMNGRLYIKGGGLLHINDNDGAVTFDMKIKGTSGNSHGIFHENEDGASIILEGADGMPSTTLASAPTENATSLSFTDASNFAEGEWFAVFDNSTAQTNGTNNATSMRDEGFIVHAIDGNTVYFRHFVGPDDVTILQSVVGGNKITVSNAKKFRKGQYVVFNRYISYFTPPNRVYTGQITDINYHTNELTLSNNIAHNSTGYNVYLTGTEKPHAAGDKVRKVATVVRTPPMVETSYTVSVASGTNSYGTGNKYYITGESGASPTLTLIVGKRYDFRQEGSSNSGHPLRISTTANGTHGGGTALGYPDVSPFGTPGTSYGGTVFTPQTTGTYYYYCSNHSGMGGQINVIANPNEDVDVANATQFAAGDQIFVASPWESGVAYYNDHSSYIHTIASVSGNDITLTTGASYSIPVGAFVTRVSRNITIGGATTDDHVYYLGDSYTSNYNRINIQKDVHFKDIGNTSNNLYGGWTIRGYFNSKASLKNVTMTQTVPANDQAPWTEGVTATFLRQRDHNGLWQWSCRYSKLRCCFVHNAYNGYHPYWHDGNGVYNCISSRNSNLVVRAEGQRNNNEIAYNYFNRQYYGLRVSTGEYEAGFGIHHNIFDAFSHYASNVSSGTGYGIDGLYCNDFRGAVYGHYSEGGATHLYSRTQEAQWGQVLASGVGIHGGTQQAGSAYQGARERGTKGYHNASTHLEWNFEVDLVAQYGYNTRRIWDVDEQAWAVRKRNTSNGRFGATVYLPPNSTLRVSLDVKLDAAPASEYPKLQLQSMLGQQTEDRMQHAVDGNTRFSSDRINTTATSASIGAYETLEGTYAARDYGCTVNICWGQNPSADVAGFYHKDPIIRIDTPYERYMWVANSSPNLNFVPDIRSSFTQQKKRLGGRIK